jgi:hypothetical protein
MVVTDVDYKSKLNNYKIQELRIQSYSAGLSLVSAISKQCLLSPALPAPFNTWVKGENKDCYMNN